MTIVPHQRTGAALRMIELRLRKAVVHEEQRATRHALADARDQRLGRRIDFALVVARWRKAVECGCAQRGIREGTLRPAQGVARRDATLEPRTIAPRDNVRRNRVEYLVQQ